MISKGPFTITLQKNKKKKKKKKKEKKKKKKKLLTRLQKDKRTSVSWCNEQGSNYKWSSPLWPPVSVSFPPTVPGAPLETRSLK